MSSDDLTATLHCHFLLHHGWRHVSPGIDCAPCWTGGWYALNSLQYMPSLSVTVVALCQQTCACADISELNLSKGMSIRFPEGKDKLLVFEITMKPDEGIYR